MTPVTAKAARISGQTFASAEEVPASSYYLNCTFSKLDLSALDFSNRTFDACRLVETRLGNCSRAKFFSCDMRRAKLTGADFRWVKTMNCDFSGADLLGIQVTVDCDLRMGMNSTLDQDGYLMLYWLALGDNPVLKRLAETEIPARIRALLGSTFKRGLS